MAKPLTSKKTAKLLSLALFLVGLAILTYLGNWWPGIMLVIGLPLAFREYLLGRRYDMWITLFVFIGVFTSVFFSWSRYLLPVLFTIGGIYIFFRDYIESSFPSEKDAEENINEEIEEEQHKK
jgi:predicted membrane protein